MEDDIRRLQAQTLAYGLVLGRLIKTVWSKEDRILNRELCCQVVEKMYDEKISPGGHEQLQAVIHDLEELFRMTLGDGEPTPQQ